jgi:hypothetical protein
MTPPSKNIEILLASGARVCENALVTTAFSILAAVNPTPLAGVTTFSWVKIDGGLFYYA